MLECSSEVGGVEGHYQTLTRQKKAKQAQEHSDSWKHRGTQHKGSMPGVGVGCGGGGPLSGPEVLGISNPCLVRYVSKQMLSSERGAAAWLKVGRIGLGLDSSGLIHEA